MQTLFFGKFNIFKAKLISSMLEAPVDKQTNFFFDPIFLKRGTFVISEHTDQFHYDQKLLS